MGKYRLSKYIGRYNQITDENLQKLRVYVESLHPENSDRDKRYVEDFHKTLKELERKDNVWRPKQNYLDRLLKFTKKVNDDVQDWDLDGNDIEDSTEDEETDDESDDQNSTIKHIDSLILPSAPAASPSIMGDDKPIPYEKLDELFKKETIEMNRLVCKPVTFDGVNPKPRLWWEDYKEAIVQNCWSEVIAIKYFSSFLKGAARDWHATVIQPRIAARTLYRVADLGALFRDNYLGEADYRELCRDLARLKQEPNESVSNFIPTALRLMQLIDNTMTEREKVRQISEKLRPEYQRDLSSFGATTMETLRSACLRVEAGLAAERALKASYSGEARGTDNNDRSSKGGSSQSGNRGANRRPSSWSKKPSSPKGGNWGSNRTGGSKPASRDGKPQGKSASSDKTCHRCGRVGHFAKDCFAKKKLDGSPIKETQPKRVNQVSVAKDESSVVTRKCMAVKSAIMNHGNSCEPVRVGRVGKVAKQTNDDGLLLVPVQVNEATVQGLVDTGSQSSIMAKSVVEENNWKPTGQFHILVNADGKPMSTPGSLKAEISLKIGKVIKTKTHTLAVAENITSPLIVGMDLLAAFEIVVDIPKMQLAFRKGSTAPGVRIPEDTIIAPRRLQVIEAQVNAVGTILVVPFQLQGDILIANSISEVVENRTDLLVCNASTEPVVLQAGKQVAGFENYDDGDDYDGVGQVSQVNLIHSLGSEEDFVNIDDDLTQEQLEELIALLSTHTRAFSLNGRLGVTNLAEHKIELLPGAQPHVEPLRRRALVDIEECHRQVQDLLKKDLIEVCDSPWAC